MSYQENEISIEGLQKHIKVLDSDEGIRIETNGEKIFVNRTSRRYCINTHLGDKDEFLYMAHAEEVLQFLAQRIGSSARIFAY
ncbi:MAG: hypothetical protein KGI33_02480 [Thaumarchaeota archaeon]|nr:hypothetical protein [Nitrososphaerota archaeon]